MEFSNLFFLYLYFPICIGIYFLAPGIKFKNALLILFSLLFYSFGRPGYVPLLLVLSLMNYALPLIIRHRTTALIMTLVINLGMLVFFKLQDRISIPLGLSFYCFSLISYQVDIFRAPEGKSRNFWHFLLFVSFFPKIIMGPIVRYSQISPQLEQRTSDPESVFGGANRFAIGLAKKVLLADPLYRVYEQLGTHASWLSGWGAGLAFMLYIYFEFSGYADMTLGLGRVFGFRLPENFRRPYSAGSVGEFWRRWHISLGSFFKDYVYIPMGGNRKGIFRQLLNLLIVWLLTGLWHGVTGTFVLWGLYFWILLSAEKLFGLLKIKIPCVMGKLITFVFVFFGWIIFASENLSILQERLVKMFSFSTPGVEPTLLVLYNSAPLMIAGFTLSVFGPIFKEHCKVKMQKAPAVMQWILGIAQWLLILGIILLCTASLMGGASKPSMYGSY